MEVESSAAKSLALPTIEFKSPNTDDPVEDNVVAVANEEPPRSPVVSSQEEDSNSSVLTNATTSSQSTDSLPLTPSSSSSSLPSSPRSSSPLSSATVAPVSSNNSNDFPISNYYYQQQPLQHQFHLQNSAANQKFPPVVQKIVRPLIPVSLIADKYLLLDQMEGSSLHKCVDIRTDEDLVCKVVRKEHSPSLLSAHYLLDSNECINRLHEVIFGETFLYLIFAPSYGDLHSYVRYKRRLKEDEGRRLFEQIVQTVSSCHEHGIVLRDLKLRKFVFADPQKTLIKLETLDDAVLLENSSSDELQDKRGCPAYVSPEILKCHTTYSGKAADIWSLGIILYTMLVGRYPFNDLHHSTLFAKITRGFFVMPEHLSLKARCLIKSLLRKEPSERLSASDILIHPWFQDDRVKDEFDDSDRVVPNFQQTKTASTGK